ncbi:hypothetical protein BAUCODRAFT_72750 [Baudoinia panamericana UAMH 10762]|uniref:STAS domain-containing protein n=1 Tax=Baudoinia panamericana (strain UAMH 10762) TaxID=717646 RepID=M2MF92_BAUPA|nr:uncharacterized protein BAUCODRAFT_72750 [Baudoinia panamericana UAMH 10762]EMC95306.1 hypothetical protein BAUCODRAFT_72750 [Baudoinia panamericana UAMH 10762]
MSSMDKVGRGLAHVLGIKLDYRDETGVNKVTRGESVYSVESADSYIEHEPTAAEWLRSLVPTGSQMMHYGINLFPFVKWIGKYNLQWLTGDLVAGITIGAIVVPQGMAYAQLALLPVQYGLYSSFMGVLIYWFFATSKDITIGPVAVLSTVTGNVVAKTQHAHPNIPAPVIASALAIISGAIVCFLGLVRLGWIVDLISLASISAFITGSAINICVGQVPNLMGITGFSARASTYKVVINSLKGLPRTKMDAALGLTSLFLLYAIRFVFQFLAKRQPNRRKMWFFLNTLRSVFVILLYTMISWLVNRHYGKTGRNPASKRSHFKILGHVPRGFQAAGVPKIDIPIIRSFVSELPATVIVLLIEHISIAKSFGRVNNYQIDPSQELVAIGVTNLLAPFLGAYPATGSFSRTAIKSKAGVRTPLAGMITAVVVLLAIYALPAVFYWIPQAALAGVIIHAVGDLITPPNVVYQFWKISPLEVVVFFAGVIVTVFTTIETGVYVTIVLSFVILIFRMFKAKGRFMGRVKVHSVIGDHLVETKEGITAVAQKSPENDPDKSVRNIFLPIDHEDGSNPNIHAEHPYPGVFIYRFSEGYNYPNANHYLDYMVETVMKTCKRTDPHLYARPGDRPWNDPGPSRWHKQTDVVDNRPTLKAIILDFSSVNNVDLTSTQHLIDVRNQLDRYAAPDRVQWHFACINNRWTKRALVSAGFGYPSPTDDSDFGRWKPIFSVAEIGGPDSAAAAAEDAERRELRRQRNDVEAARSFSAVQEVNSTPGSDPSLDSLEKEINASGAYAREASDHRIAVVQGMNRPFFHIDLTSALQSAIQNAKLHDDRYTAESKAAGLEDKESDA